MPEVSLRVWAIAATALATFGTGVLGHGMIGAVGAAETPPNATTPDGGNYFGTLKNGRFNGSGRIEWKNGARYQGQFADGLKSGQGTMRFANGDSYEGEFRDGLMQGLGRLQMRDGSEYVGDFERDRFHGRGRLEWANGDVYQGDFTDGEYHGRGTVTYKDGRKYRGEFAKGKYQGEGRFETSAGESFEGQFVDGQFTGKGSYTRPDGAFHQGQFERWRSHGAGVFTDHEGNVFEGEFTHNELSGKGRLSGKAGFVYEGEFKAWRFHGKGALRHANGDEYNGNFANGQYQGEGTLKYAKPKDDGRSEDRGLWRDGRFEDEAARRLAQENVELALYSQRPLLERALSALSTREAGRINMYLLAVGGDGTEEVFRREVQYVREQFDRDFGTRGRSLALVNSRTTVATLPMATHTSLRESLKAIAAKMNRDEDILFLFLTSHGSKDHELALNQNNMGLRGLPAKELGQMLRESNVRWKVVVVSACYGGGFVDHLKDDHTLVIAAARHDRASFGCADENDFTYFGRAYFKESLPSSNSFEEAFGKADVLVRQWEQRDHQQTRRGGEPEYSFPQIHKAAPIDEQLRRWWDEHRAKR
ncbi:MAG: C13 family peptidase [Burkholderiales bacterium]